MSIKEDAAVKLNEAYEVASRLHIRSLYQID